MRPFLKEIPLNLRISRTKLMNSQKTLQVSHLSGNVNQFGRVRDYRWEPDSVGKNRKGRI